MPLERKRGSNTAPSCCKDRSQVLKLFQYFYIHIKCSKIHLTSVAPSTHMKSTNKPHCKDLIPQLFWFFHLLEPQVGKFWREINIFRSLRTQKRSYCVYSTGASVSYTFTLNEGLLSDCFYPNRQLVQNTRNGQLKGQSSSSSQSNYIRLLELCS